MPLKPYWPFRDELIVEDGKAMKSHRIIIPTVLQKDILTKLHAAHQGIEKAKLRARASVYWRVLNKNIDEITKTCSTCQELHPSKQKEPLILTEEPPRAWHTIGTDVFTLEGSEYLVVADYYSKYPFVRKIPRGQVNSHTVIKMQNVETDFQRAGQEIKSTDSLLNTVTLIPKENSNLLHLTTWRPITLLNLDYKIASKDTKTTL